MNGSTQKLSDAGVSIWFDDFSHDRLTSGNLVELPQVPAQAGLAAMVFEGNKGKPCCINLSASLLNSLSWTD